MGRSRAGLAFDPSVDRRDRMRRAGAGGRTRRRGRRQRALHKNAAALATPNNDASDLARALTGLGFKVELRLDADKRGFDRAVEQFARAAQSADAALFYYVGHGMQFHGHDYLAPVDADLNDEFSVRYELTAVDEVTAGPGEVSSGVKS